MKVFVPLLCLAALAFAEPPVSDGYPDARSSHDHNHHDHDHHTADHQRSPSQEYGPPAARSSDFNGYEYDAPNARNSVNARGQSRFPPATVRVSYNQRFSSAAARKSDHAATRSGISQEYGTPAARSPAQEYGTPAARSPSQEYGAPAARSPSQEYGAPAARSPSQEYGTPAARSPSQEYGAPAARSPSQEYGTPAARSLSQEYGTPAARSPSQEYGTPAARSPSQEYGTPAARSPSQEYGAPSIVSARTPSTEYGSPNARLAPSEEYGAPVEARSQKPSFNFRGAANKPASRSQADTQSHGYSSSARSNEISEDYAHKSSFSRNTPSPSYGAPSIRNSNAQGYDSVSQTYGVPDQKEPSETYGAPNARSLSQEYGAPASRTSQTDAVASSYPAARSSPSSAYLPAARDAMPSPQYGVPNQDSQGYDNAKARALNELLNQEPASYDFGYQIEDQESGSDFGHSETREENRAEGSYFVVLPDGTKQTVEYEADEGGFRPRISVEPARAGYDDNAQDVARSAGPY